MDDIFAFLREHALQPKTGMVFDLMHIEDALTAQDSKKVNGKIVFRQYVAILENTFSEDSRSWTAIMESNTLPEVDPEGLDLAQLRKERAEAKAAKDNKAAAPAVNAVTAPTATESPVAESTKKAMEMFDATLHRV